MAVENAGERVRRSLEAKLGVEETAYVMDRPPGGWSNLVTTHYLDARFEGLEARIQQQFAELSASVDRRLRAQTWVTATTLIAGLGLFGLLEHL